MDNRRLYLAPWQKKFVDQFLKSKNQRNLLVAAAGTGKTVTSIVAAYEKLKTGKCKVLVVVTDSLELREQWRHVAKEVNLELGEDLSQLTKNLNVGASVTYQSLLYKDRLETLRVLSTKGGLLLIVDEVHRYQDRAISVCEQIIKQEPSNQCLFISRTPIIGQAIDWRYEFGREYLFQPSLIRRPETRIQIVKYSPSINLLEQLKRRITGLDDLKWRQLEILVSELLETDGYKIELMSGNKDGGVDIVAIKDLGELGMFKTLWQAKKYSISRKIGISTIRELADVRNEFGASKAFVVTTSFLTSGALERVQRDKYILGKVDRSDLIAWINRKLYE